jgi:hypothetical protein
MSEGAIRTPGKSALRKPENPTPMWALAVRGQMITVGEPPSPPRNRALSYAPLAVCRNPTEPREGPESSP